MFCRECGTELSNIDVFCTNCGAPVINLDKDDTAEETLQSLQEENVPDLPGENAITPMLNEQEVSFAENNPIKKILHYFKKNRTAAIAIAGVVVLVVGLVSVFSIFQQPKEIPHEYEEAKKFFEKQNQEIAECIGEEDYIGLFKALDSLEIAIDNAFKLEGEKAYSPEIIALCQEQQKENLERKLARAAEVSKVLYEGNMYEELTRFYDASMLNLENRDELLDRMIRAFTEERNQNKAEMLMHERLNPFTVEAFNAVLEHKDYLNTKISDRNIPYGQIDAKKYDRALAYIDGFAKVAINVAEPGADKMYKWGLIDDGGKTIVDTQYDIIGMYLDGLAAVMKDGRWGFINEFGELTIPLEYEDIKDTQDAVFYAYIKRDPDKVARGFYDGFAAVKKNGKWGFIDTQGRPIGEGFVYDDVQYFNEGVAAVQKGGSYGFIDTTGEYIIYPGQPQFQGVAFEIIRPIYEGLAGANWDGRKERGIVDKEGYITHVFDREEVDLIQDFREGLASVRKRNGTIEKWGFANRYGQLVIPIQYDSVTVFINGVSRVSKDGKFGLIDRRGYEILPMVYDSISEFNDGYAIIGKDGKFGFVNEIGAVIAEPKYQEATRFANGLAPVKLDGKWGAINDQGEMILGAVFDGMKAYNNGVAPAKYGENWGYVDLSGYFLIDPIFEQANSFSEGMASVRLDGKYRYIKLDEIPVNLDGQVLDDNNDPIAAAIINVYSNDDIPMEEAIYSTKSDQNGMFKIVLPAGEYKIVASKDGYVESWSYENIADEDYNYAAALHLAKGTRDELAEAAVVIGNAFDGQGLSGTNVYFRQGYNNRSGAFLCDDTGQTIRVTTDETGKFSTTLPLGTYTAEASKDGYATTYINFISSKTGRSGLRSLAMTQVLPEGETRITLEWGARPPDLDSHLVGPTTNEYEQFHLYYANMNPAGSNCSLDKDDTMGNGFETTTIRNQREGAYRFSVFDYTNGDNYDSYEMSQSGARVNVYRGDRYVASFDIPANKLGNLWEVFEIRDDRIIPINNVTNHHDLSFYSY